MQLEEFGPFLLLLFSAAVWWGLYKSFRLLIKIEAHLRRLAAHAEADMQRTRQRRPTPPADRDV